MKHSIKTLKNVIADDIFDINDYPACVLFWTIAPDTLTEGLGDKASIIELVTGNKTVFSTNSTWTHEADGAFRTNSSSSAIVGSHAIKTPSLPVLDGTKYPVTIMVYSTTGAGSSDGFIIGGNGSNEDSIRSDKTFGSFYLANSSGMFHIGGVNNDTQAIGSWIKRGSSVTKLIETDGNLCADTGIAMSGAYDSASIDLSSNSNCLSLSCAPGETLDLYGIAVFEFESEPVEADIIQAVSWCNYQWRNGKQGVLPPTWKNKT